MTAQAQAQIRALGGSIGLLNSQVTSSSAVTTQLRNVEAAARLAMQQLTQATRELTSAHAALEATNQAEIDSTRRVALAQIAAEKAAISLLAAEQRLASVQEGGIAASAKAEAEARKLSAADASLESASRSVRTALLSQEGAAISLAAAQERLAQVQLNGSAANAKIEADMRRLSGAEASLTTATLSLNQAQLKLASANAAIVAGTEPTSVQLEKITLAEINLEKAQIAVAQATERLAILQVDSAASAEAAAIAQDKITAAEFGVEKANIAVASSSERLAAAFAGVTQAQERLAILQDGSARSAQELAAAEAQVAAAARALEQAQLSVAASTERLGAAQEALDATLTGTAAATARVAAAEQALAAAQTEAAAASVRLDEANTLITISSTAAAAAAKKEAESFDLVSASAQRSAERTNRLGALMGTNFTVPILIAAGAATKWELDNEKAMTNVAKVYGDLDMDPTTKINELNALGKAFEALSNRFGVNRAKVIDIAAGWAQAGTSGLALAKSVETTLKTMSIGELDAADATTALISIQAQYHQSADELINTIATLNIIENQTGITMKGLIDGFSRAAGVARNAGIDVAHLGAYLAALTPAAGSATTAGNGLKSIITDLEVPTKKASDALAAMGIITNDPNWMGLNGQQKFEVFAQKFVKLDDSTKQYVAATVAGKFQLNRFNTVMEAIGTNTGFYKAALDAAQGTQGEAVAQTRNLAQAEKELNQVLDSNPQKLKQIGVVLQNVFADTMQPLIPTIIEFAVVIKDIAEAFRKLSPEVQKSVIFFLLFVAVFGPILRFLASFKILISLVIGIFSLLGATILGVGKILLVLIAGPLRLLSAAISVIPAVLALIPSAFALWPVALLAAIVALGVIFHSQLSQIWDDFISSIGSGDVKGALKVIWDAFVSFIQGIASGFEALPDVVASALQSVFDVISTIMTKIVDVLSYLNPFERHSPSLVDNVTLGVAEIVRQFGSIKQISVPLISAVKDIQAFQAATKGATDSIQNLEDLKDFNTVIKISPTAGAAFVQLKSDAKSLTSILQVMKDQVQAQTDVVQAWTDALKSVDNELDQQKSILDNLKKVAQNYSDELKSAQDDLQKLASTPITGMQDMQDQIFANTQAQKKLRLEIIEFEQAAGGYDAVAEKIKNLQKVVDDLNSKLQQANDDLQKFANTPIEGMGAMDDQIFANEQAQKKLRLEILNLSDASGSLDSANAKLKDLENTASDLSDQLQQAQDDLSKFASAPIQGMQEMSDQIFANDQAQKALRLEMLKLQDVTGPIDDVKDRLSKLAGEIDSLRGEQKSLRVAGAGSDILSQYDQQVSQLEAQQKTISDTSSKYDDLNSQLQKLQNTGEELDLTNSLKFDPLNRQIQELSSNINELPFDVIIAGIKEAKSRVDQYTTSLSDTNDKIKDQTAVVKILQDQYDILQEKLQDLENEGERLDLEKSLQFDPLIRQIQELVNGMDELPFDQIIAGIKDAKSRVDQYTKSLKDANTALDDEQKIMDVLQDQLDSLNKALADLQTEAEKLDLENSLKFDDLQRQIDKLSSSLKEMSFDDIIKGITDANSRIKQYTESLNDANKAVDAQSEKVDSLQTVRDAMNKQLEAEQSNLDKLKDAYDKVDKAVESIDKTLQQFLQSASKAGNVGSNIGEGAQNGINDLNKSLGDGSLDIDKFTKDQTDKFKKMFTDVDWRGTIKKKWEELEGYVKDKWNDMIKWLSEHPWATAILGAIGGGIIGGPLGAVIGAIVGGIIGAIPQLKDAWDAVWMVLEPVFDWVKEKGEDFWNFLTDGNIFSTIKTKLSEFNNWLRDNIPGVAEIEDILNTLGKLIYGFSEILQGFFSGDFGEIWSGIKDVVSAAFMGVFDVITDAGKTLLNDIEGIFGGMWDGIKSIFEGSGTSIMPVLDKIVRAILHFFEWLYDELVGHSVVPDLVNEIVAWFGKLFDLALTELNKHMPQIIDFFINLGLQIGDAFIKNMPDFEQEFAKFTDGAIQALGELTPRIIEDLIEMLGSIVKELASYLGSNVLDFFKSIPEMIINAIGDVTSVLESVGQSLISGLINGILKGLASLFSEGGSNINGILIGALKSIFDIVDWGLYFAQKGLDAITGFLGGIYNGLLTGGEFIAGIPLWILQKIGDLSKLLWDVGVSIVEGLWDGMKYVFGHVLDFIGDIPGLVVSAIKGVGNLATILFDAGKALLQGFWDGLKSIASSIGSWVASFVGGIWDSIKGIITNTDPSNNVSFDATGIIGAISSGSDKISSVIDFSFRNLIAVSTSTNQLIGVVDYDLKNLTSVIQNQKNETSTPPVQAPTGGGNIYNFYGGISLPNITNSDDAKLFLQNLETLANSA